MNIVFVNIYNGLENKNILTEKIPFNNPFVKKGEDIIRMTLYSFHRLFEALQTDIAYISFLAKSAVDPKLCLLFIDLFTSKIYTYLMGKRNLLAKKMEEFYNDIDKKKLGNMRLQTDQEFKQTIYKNLKKKLIQKCIVCI